MRSSALFSLSSMLGSALHHDHEARIVTCLFSSTCNYMDDDALQVFVEDATFTEGSGGGTVSADGDGVAERRAGDGDVRGDGDGGGGLHERRDDGHGRGGIADELRGGRDRAGRGGGGPRDD